MINFFKEKIELDLEGVIKLHMLVKSYQMGYNLSNADINILYELYRTGYGNTFYANCLGKKYFKTKQTIRNSIGKMTNLGILSYRKRGERIINPDFCPKISQDQVIFQYLIGNVNNGNQREGNL